MREAGWLRRGAAGERYQPYHNVRDPYLDRRLPSASQEQRALPVGENGSPYARQGVKHPFWRRSVAGSSPPSHPHATHFLDPTQLQGDAEHLSLRIHQFFGGVLDELRRDAGSFPRVVSELLALLSAHHIKVRRIEAYSRLRSWDALLATLEELARYPSMETFSLFCGAILAYHERTAAQGRSSTPAAGADE